MNSATLQLCNAANEEGKAANMEGDSSSAVWRGARSTLHSSLLCAELHSCGLAEFASLIAQAQCGALPTGPLLLPIGGKRHVSTHNLNRVVMQAVTVTFADPQPWRVTGCAMLLRTVQTLLTAPALPDAQQLVLSCPKGPGHTDSPSINKPL